MDNLFQYIIIKFSRHKMTQYVRTTITVNSFFLAKMELETDFGKQTLATKSSN